MLWCSDAVTVRGFAGRPIDHHGQLQGDLQAKNTGEMHLMYIQVRTAF